jgi:hypothetical protein
LEPPFPARRQINLKNLEARTPQIDKEEPKIKNTHREKEPKRRKNRTNKKSKTTRKISNKKGKI